MLELKVSLHRLDSFKKNNLVKVDFIYHHIDSMAIFVLWYINNHADVSNA